MTSCDYTPAARFRVTWQQWLEKTKKIDFCMRILNMFWFSNRTYGWAAILILKLHGFFFEDRILSLVRYCTAFYSVSHVVCVKEENWNALTAPCANMPTLLWANHLFGPWECSFCKGPWVIVLSISYMRKLWFSDDAWTICCIHIANTVVS